MQTTVRRIEDARAPLWFGSWPAGWGDVVQTIRPDRTTTAADAIRAGGLDWQVIQCPLETVPPAHHTGEPQRVQVPRHVANVRADTGQVLGVVGDQYSPLQNHAAFAFCDAITDSGRAHWIGAGATRHGARVHALMQLDREIRIGDTDGEDVLPLLCLRNGHDGGLSVTVSVAPFRLACLNGMIFPLPDAARTWKARHTPNLDGKLAEARRALGIAWHYYDQLEQLGAQLLTTRMGAGEFERFLAQLVPLPNPAPDPSGGGRAVRNVERVRNAIRTCHRDSDDLNNVRGTRWAALQAVTSYVDHQQPTRQRNGRTIQEARFERATDPNPLKDRALELLTT